MMNTHQQNRSSFGEAEAGNVLTNDAAQTFAVSAITSEEVYQVGISRIGYAYIYEKPDTSLPSDADLIFRYDEAGNQILREMRLP